MCEREKERNRDSYKYVSMKKVEVCVCVRERERKRDRDKYVSMKEVEVCEDREEKCIRKRERVPIGKRKIIYM